ncbi:MAG: M23 family metallopeptidase [Verrucomicrobiales bacterium]
MAKWRTWLWKLGLPVAVACALVLLAIWRGARQAHDERPVPPPVLSADTLAARAGLLPLPATDYASAPLAAQWDMPMGGHHGAFTYNAQPFLAPNPGRGGLHLGDDLNGIGQENTDLHDPVFAPADGRVVYAGHPSAGWGGVIILLHRTPAGEWRQSFFGHLDPDALHVVPGEWVPRGRKLGRLALTTAVDYAHLHYEIRRGVTLNPGPGYAPEGARLSDDTVKFTEKEEGIVGLPAAADYGREPFRTQSGDGKAPRKP